MGWQKRADVFEKSYDEVLAALKHQDDKLNRTLTAIAFLTAAGIFLFANVARNVSSPVRFPDSARDVVGFFFLIFLGSVVFSLVFALAAIGPSKELSTLGRQKPKQREKWPSLLFYARITRDPAWSRHIWKSDTWLTECLARNLHDETRTLARRIEYKVARSRESGSFVQVAILSLSLLGIFSVEQLSFRTRWTTASVLLIAMLAMPLWDLLHMWAAQFSDRKQLKKRWISYALVLTSLAAGVTLLVAAPAWHRHWWAIVYALSAILATRLATIGPWYARLCLSGAAVGGVVSVVLAWHL